MSWTFNISIEYYTEVTAFWIARECIQKNNPKKITREEKKESALHK